MPDKPAYGMDEVRSRRDQAHRYLNSGRTTTGQPLTSNDRGYLCGLIDALTWILRADAQTTSFAAYTDDRP